MVRIIKEHWTLIIALGLLYLTTAILLILSLGQNQGHLIYALDDSYRECK